jgi:hypothetical protein
MSEYQQIVDEIRFALQSEDCELTEELRAAALGYAQACREVNQRLRKIGTYLDSGLRSEAIQLAEGPPSIDEVVGILMFPELDAWADVVAIYDLPRHEPLNQDVISRLQEAQVIELPLQHLLSRHRLLALHRAPLKMRLDVLRELKAADPETTAWEEDVRLFENARLQEIAEEVRAARQKGDLAQLKRLQEEVSEKNWLEVPPAKVIHSIRAAAGELTRISAQRQLEELLPQLEAAFSELDFPRARELAKRWNEALSRAGTKVNTSLTDQVAPILGWIQDEEAREAVQRQYQQLTAQLEHALDQSLDIEELDRLVHEILRLDREVPELLAIRYANRREAIQISQTRAHRLQLGSALAVVVGIAIGIGFLVRHQLSANEAERVASQVEKLIEDRQFDQAQAMLAKRNDVTKWDRLAELQARIDTELNKEKERQALFEASLSKARNATSHSEAMDALAQARSHAVTPQEKLAVSEVQRDRERQHDEMIAAREAAVGNSILEVSEELSQLDQAMGSASGDEKTAHALVQLASRIGELQKETQGLRPEYASQVQLLAARRKELEDLRNQRLLYQQRIAELTLCSKILVGARNSNDAIDRFRAALIAYADSIPQEQAAEMYRRRAGEDLYWKSAMRWANQMNQWKEVWPQDLAEISERMAWCKTFIADNPTAPDAALAKKYVEQLESITAITGHIDGSGTGLQARLERIFSIPLVEKSWCLKVRDGRIFYSPHQTPITATGFHNFKFFIGYGLDDLDTQKGIQASDFVSREPSPSPSQLIAKYVKSRLSSLKAEEWNSFCLELSTRILNEEELNPFLKLDLLKRCLELSSNGDIFLKDQLSPHLKLLQGASINPLARWMNPDDVEGKRASDDAREILTRFQRLKDLETVWKDAERQRDVFTNSMRRTVAMVGWLQVGEEWTFHIEGDDQLPASDLFVIYVPSEGKAGEWRTVGQFVNGRARLKPGAQEFLAAGRPLFALPVPGEATVINVSSPSSRTQDSQSSR